MCYFSIKLHFSKINTQNRRLRMDSLEKTSSFVFKIAHKNIWHFVFVFVLMGWSFLPNALRHFKIYCAPLKLGIRT